ncbi:Ig-like domain-containing protein [Paenibacillus sp. YIM B09110]|uniref:Ig-like domain-containing protein n=1 Tax=Paenibacillus sp. YIM B09110 TaxID=3126102 RepID=UPI00301DA0F0
MVQLFVLPIGQASANAELSVDSLSKAPISEGNTPSTVVTMKGEVPVYTTQLENRVGDSRSTKAKSSIIGSANVVDSGDILTVVVPTVIANPQYNSVDAKIATKQVYGAGSTDYYYSLDFLDRNSEYYNTDYDYTVEYGEDNVKIRVESIDWTAGSERFLLLTVGSYAIKLPFTSADKGKSKTVNLSKYIPVTIDLPNKGEGFAFEQNLVTYVDGNQKPIGASAIANSGIILVEPDTYNLQINARDDEKAYLIFKKNVTISNQNTLSIALSTLAKVSLQMDDEDWEQLSFGVYPQDGGYNWTWFVGLYKYEDKESLKSVYVSKLNYSETDVRYQSKVDVVSLGYNQGNKNVTGDFTFQTDTNLKSKINLTQSSYKANSYLFNPDTAGIVDGRGNHVTDIYDDNDRDTSHSIIFTNKVTNAVFNINPYYLSNPILLPDVVGDYTMTYIPGAGAKYFGLETVSAPIKLTANGSNVTLSSLTVNKSSINMIGFDKTESITASATFSDRSKQDVTYDASWTSSNENVATVDNGAITSTGVGTATITVNYGGKSQAVKVSVVAKQLKSLGVTPTKLTGRTGNSYDVALTATYSDNSNEAVTETANWSSNKPEVATFDDGKVQVNGYGSATLTAEFGGKKATVSVNSAAKNVYISTTITDKPKLLTMKPGDSQQLAMKAQFADSIGSKPEVISSGVEWSSENSEVASITEAGLLTVNDFGTTNVTAEYKGLTVTIKVDASIKALSITDSANPKGIKSLNLHPNQVKSDLVVKATLQDNKQVNVENEDVTWASDNENVVSVDNSGALEVNGFGKANITAIFGGKPVKIAVSVALSSLKANFSKIAGKGEYDIVLTATYGDKYTEDVAEQAVWTSSSSVATVEDGYVTINGLGKGKITASFGDAASKNAKTVSIPVDVSVKSFTSPTKKITGVPGKEYEVALLATLSDGKADSAEDVAAGTVWSTSNATVATAENGVITIIGVGKANITAVYGGKKVTVAVDVPFTLSVSESKLTIGTGEIVSYIVTATFSDNSTLDVTDLATFAASGKGIVDVSEGNITALKAGSSTITLKFGGKSTTIKVTVTNSSIN